MADRSFHEQDDHRNNMAFVHAQSRTPGTLNTQKDPRRIHSTADEHENMHESIDAARWTTSTTPRQMTQQQYMQARHLRHEQHL